MEWEGHHQWFLSPIQTMNELFIRLFWGIIFQFSLSFLLSTVTTTTISPATIDHIVAL